MIQLDELAFVKATQDCWELHVMVPTNPDRHNTKHSHRPVITYHSTFKQAVEDYADQCLKQSETIQDVLIKLNELSNLVQNIPDLKRSDYVK